MKAIICLAGLTLFLAGCAPRATEVGYRDLLESYRGQHIDQLVSAWGPPQAKHDFADGRRVYSFITHSRQPAPVTRPFIGVGGVLGHRSYGGLYLSTEMTMREHYCETRVETDRKGRITGYNFKGNACRAYQAPTAGPDGQARAYPPDGGPAWATVCGPNSSPDCGPAYPPGWGPAHGPW